VLSNYSPVSLHLQPTFSKTVGLPSFAMPDAFRLFLIITSFLFVANSSGYQQIPLQIALQNDINDHFIPFDRFISQVRTAKYDDYKCNPVQDEDAFEEMKAHILKMYSGVTKASSFIQEDEYVDCIAIMEQPTVHLLGITEIPQPPINSTHDREGDGYPPGRTRYVLFGCKLSRCGSNKNLLSFLIYS
jgi:hypothetical protein